jgi:hypothetical protein
MNTVYVIEVVAKSDRSTLSLDRSPFHVGTFTNHDAAAEVFDGILKSTGGSQEWECAFDDGETCGETGVLVGSGARVWVNSHNRVTMKLRVVKTDDVVNYPTFLE